METDNKLSLAFGRRTWPEDVRAVWGARLIWPNDLLYDRQDLDAHDNEAKTALIHWLNNGAIAKMREVLGAPEKRYSVGMYPTMPMDEESIIYEDDFGKIVGSPQGSGGYLYVCGWLKEN